MSDFPYTRSACQPSPYVLPRVERAKVGQPLTVILLGAWRGVYGHWNEGRSYPCNGEACGLHNTELIWWGYCPALLFKSAAGPYTPCIAEVTEHAAMMLGGVTLRGTVVQFTREVHRRDARVRAELLDVSADPRHLPHAFDVEPILRRMWKCGPLAKHEAPPLLPTVSKVTTLTLQTYTPAASEEQEEQKKPDFKAASRAMVRAAAEAMKP